MCHFILVIFLIGLRLGNSSFFGLQREPFFAISDFTICTPLFRFLPENCIFVPIPLNFSPKMFGGSKLNV